MRIAYLLALVGVVAPLAANAETCVGSWGQCGGSGYTGATCCISGWTCTYSNAWYSQCLQSTSTTTATPTTTTPTTTKTATTAPTTTKTATTATPTTTPTPTTTATSSGIYPSYNTNPLAANATGMSSTATQLAAKIKLGFNIGNTLEATGGETAWGNPLITQTFVNAVKSAGFSAIRLPVAWDGHADQTTALIDATWMARVKTVVGYCVDAGLYVIVNIHWDGGWLESHVTTSDQTAVNAKQLAYWQQIATALREFDEHVIFASANEPSASTAEAMTVLLSYHQTFINAVRSTGGHNTYRNLVIQGPSTDIDTTSTLMTTMPTDTISGRMMVEIHWYSPYQFTLMTADASWGNQFYYWGAANHNSADTAHNPTWGEEDYVTTEFAKMKSGFVDKGYPVIIGEYMAIDRKDTLSGTALTLHEASRAYFDQVVAQKGLADGMIPFYWDTGSLISRSTNAVLDQQSLTGLLTGAGLA